MDLDKLYERVAAMSEEERAALDPICKALDDYMDQDKSRGRVIPNRVIALACADLTIQWERLAASHK